MSANRVLVTGADGFIGSHVVESLVRGGRTVRAFVFYNSFDSRGWLDRVGADILEDVEIVAGDVRDSDMVRAAVRGCDTVLHLAALIAIPYSYRSPASYVQTNVTGTLNVLQAAADFEASHIVHTSTSEVYGTAQYAPIDEDHPLSAQSPYAATKIGADQIALSLHRSFGTPVTIIRPFNTYGPRQSLRAVIPTIITQAVAGAPRLRLGALHPTRDFNYVADVASAFVAACQSDAAMGEVVNIGSNFEIAIGEVVEVVAQVLGCTIDVETEYARLRPVDSEVDRLWADSSKAKRLLGWEPKFGGREGFRRGIAETVSWYQDPENLKMFRHEHNVL